MIIEEDFNRDFLIKIFLPEPEFKPMTFLLVSSCMGSTTLKGICITPIDHFALLVASTLGDLAEVTKTTTVVTSNDTQRVE